MGMKEFKKAIELIEEDGSGDFEEPKSPALVQAAEQRLGVTFPPTYKEFLLQLGCGDIAGVEFYGLIDDNFDQSSVPNGIWLTLNVRAQSNLDLALILIEESMEGYYAIDTSRRDAAGECPVVDWIPTVPTSQLEMIASDFGTFFFEEVKFALENENKK